MNYEVTATRKRPRSFDGLVGQEFVVASLKNSLRSGRIAHAYLFSGPRGVGKTSAARILARALNAPDGPNGDGGEEYPGSEEIARGTAIDVIEIDGASNTSVNDVRQIKDEVLFAPTTSRYKIYIIDEVHMLSNSAFNALLKTIEEPPPYIIFIFATTEIHKVPATIRSRCQQFNFRLIPVDEIKAKLAEVAVDMSIRADDEAVFWVAKEATGSLRDAYTLFDQVVSFSDGHITLDKIREKLGLVGLDNLNDIADAIADGDGRRLVELSDEIVSRGVSVDQFTIDLAEYFRSILFIRKGIHKESLLGFSPDRFSGKILKALSDTQVEYALELLLSLYRAIRYSLNQRFDLDLTMSKLAGLRDRLSSREILQEMQELRESLSMPPVTRGANGAAMQRESTAMPGEAGQQEQDHHIVPPPPARGLRPEHAADIIMRIRPTRLALSSALEKAVRWSLADSELFIEFDSAYPANAARGEEEVIRNAAADVLGKPVLVRIKVEPGKNDAEPGSQADEHDSQIEVIKRVFRGEVVDGDE
jgi:DNA polymerase III subunit gamma/tau